MSSLTRGRVWSFGRSVSSAVSCLPCHNLAYERLFWFHNFDFQASYYSISHNTLFLDSVHCPCDHLHHVKSGALHSLMHRGKGRNDFNRKITNILHDLILNEYPQHFTDCIVKPVRSNRPSSDRNTMVRSLSHRFGLFTQKFSTHWEQF
jgi:hypothetical protein